MFSDNQSSTWGDHPPKGALVPNSTPPHLATPILMSNNPKTPSLSGELEILDPWRSGAVARLKNRQDVKLATFPTSAQQKLKIPWSMLRPSFPLQPLLTKFTSLEDPTQSS